jgi:PadR family transcriptional regulator, regulatory protein PadR
MPPLSVPMLQGSLDGLVLKTLTWGPMHGYGIARWIQQLTDEALRVEEGSLYAALYRMENRGWITAEWGISETNRRAKYYRLTATGRRQLARESESCLRLASAMTKVFAATKPAA